MFTATTNTSASVVVLEKHHDQGALVGPCLVGMFTASSAPAAPLKGRFKEPYEMPLGSGYKR
jgi:hypothetical protein